MRSFTKKNVEYTSDIYRFLYDKEAKYENLRNFLSSVVQNSDIALFRSDASDFVMKDDTVTTAFDAFDDNSFNFLSDFTELKIIEEKIKKYIDESKKPEIEKVAKILLLKQILKMAQIRSKYDYRFTYQIVYPDKSAEIRMNQISGNIKARFFDKGKGLSNAPPSIDEDIRNKVNPKMISYIGFHEYALVSYETRTEKKSGVYINMCISSKPAWKSFEYTAIKSGRKIDYKVDFTSFLDKFIVSKIDKTAAFKPQMFTKENKLYKDIENIIDYEYWEPFLGADGYGDSKQFLIFAEGLYCAYCESSLNDGLNMDIEHKIPKSIFPTESLSWENFVTACKYCNEIFKSNNFAAKTFLTPEYKLELSSAAEQHYVTDRDLSFTLAKLEIESKLKVQFEKDTDYIDVTLKFNADGFKEKSIATLTRSSRAASRGAVAEKKDEKTSEFIITFKVDIKDDDKWEFSCEFEINKNEIMTYLYADALDKDNLISFIIGKFKAYSEMINIKNAINDKMYAIIDYKEVITSKLKIDYNVSGSIFLQKKSTDTVNINKYFKLQESSLNIVYESNILKANLKLKYDDKEFEIIDIASNFKKYIPKIIGDNTMSFCGVIKTSGKSEKVIKGYKFEDDLFRKGYIDSIHYAKDNVIWPDIKNNKVISFKIFNYKLYEDKAGKNKYDTLIDSIYLNDINKETNLLITDDGSGYKMQLVNLNRALSLSNLRVIAVCNDDIHKESFDNTVFLCGLNTLGKSVSEVSNESSEETEEAGKKKKKKQKDMVRYFNDQRILRRTKAWLNAMKQLRLLQCHFNEQDTLSIYYKKNLDLFCNDGFVSQAAKLEVSPNKEIIFNFAIDESDSSINSISYESKEINYIVKGNKIVGKMNNLYFKGTYSISEDGKKTKLAISHYIEVTDNKKIEEKFFEWEQYQQQLLAHLNNSHDLLTSYIWENILAMVCMGGFYSTWVRTFEKYSTGKELENLKKRFDIDLVRELEIRAQENQTDPFQFHGTDALEIIDHLEKAK